MSRNTLRTSALLVASAAVPCSPSSASAHLVTTGMRPVYDGIGHLLLTPEDMIPVLALALYAGLRGAATSRRATCLLPVAWFVGGLVGAAAPLATVFPVPAVSFLVIGGLVAVDFCLPPTTVAGLAIVLGLAHGGMNGAVLREGPATLGVVGITVVLYVLVTLVTAFIVSLDQQWARIAVRVLGSWIAAIGLLMCGWAMR